MMKTLPTDVHGQLEEGCLRGVLFSISEEAFLALDRGIQSVEMEESAYQELKNLELEKKNVFFYVRRSVESSMKGLYYCPRRVELDMAEEYDEMVTRCYVARKEILPDLTENETKSALPFLFLQDSQSVYELDKIQVSRLLQTMQAKRAKETSEPISEPTTIHQTSMHTNNVACRLPPNLPLSEPNASMPNTSLSAQLTPMMTPLPVQIPPGMVPMTAPNISKPVQMDKDLGISDLQKYFELQSNQMDQLEQCIKGRMNQFEQQIQGKMDQLEQRLEGRMDRFEQQIQGRITEILRTVKEVHEASLQVLNHMNTASNNENSAAIMEQDDGEEENQIVEPVQQSQTNQPLLSEDTAYASPESFRYAYHAVPYVLNPYPPPLPSVHGANDPGGVMAAPFFPPVTSHMFNGQIAMPGYQMHHVDPDEAQHYETMPSVPLQASDEQLMLIGGYASNRRYVNTMELFDVRSSTWSLYLDFPVGMTLVSGSAECVKGHLFLIGGIEGNVYSQSVRRLNLETYEWDQVSRTRMARAGICSTKLGDKIYLLGDRNQYSKAVETFDPHVSTWSRHHPLLRDRARHDATSSPERNAIYVFGGSKEPNSHDLGIERWDPREPSWQEIGLMNCTREAACGSIIEDYLYVVGGIKGQRPNPQATDLVEIFDLRMGSWLTNPVPSLNHRRWDARAITLRNVLYVVGGSDDTGTFKGMEKLEKGDSLWTGNLPAGHQVTNRVAHSIVAVPT